MQSPQDTPTKKLRVIITGATGMVGMSITKECLNHPDIEAVLTVTRRPVKLEHPKLQQCHHKDFMRLDPIKMTLRGWDACFFCLGATSIGKSETDYRQLTYDISLHFAKVYLASNPKSTFCFISGSGTNKHSRQMWARVKGQTEEALLKLPFRSAAMFRLGFFEPAKGVEMQTQWIRLAYGLAKPLLPWLRRQYKLATTSKRLAQAMITVTQSGTPKPILESVDINKLGGAP